MRTPHIARSRAIAAGGRLQSKRCSDMGDAAAVVCLFVCLLVCLFVCLLACLLLAVVCLIVRFYLNGALQET
jgi:hypothetical protein